MLYDKPLNMSKKPPQNSIRRKRSKSKSLSTSKETLIVKSNSEPTPLLDEVKKLDFKKDHQIKMNSTTLLHDPIYSSLFYSLLLFPDMEIIKELQNHVDDIFNLIIRSFEKINDNWAFSLLQIVLFLECIKLKDKEPEELGDFCFCPSFSLFCEKDDSLEPKPPAIIAPLIATGNISYENAEILMKKFLWGVDPSTPDGKRVAWNGPIEMLVIYLVVCYLRNLLIVPYKKLKKHRDKEEDRPPFYNLIKNHFSLSINHSTIHRNCECIFDYLLDIQEQYRSHFDTNKKLICLLEKYPPSSFGNPMRKSRFKNIISACGFLPE
jgi:hypothetical protein